MAGKKIIGKIHLWLGLASGLVVFIVAITGCIYVFQKEITELTQRSKLFVTVPAGAQPLPVSRLLQLAQHAMGDSIPVNSIDTYKERDRAWEFMAYADGDEKALSIWGSVKYYRSVHLNPYTGAVTGTTDYTREFFVIIKYLHWSLLLNTPYGQPIVGWSTFIFVILLITGLVLWWPKKWNKASRKNNFRVKWNARWRRLNYDLHSVLGFYGMLIALILSLTGMVWALRWFGMVVYVAAAGTTKPPEPKEIKSVDTLVVAKANTLDMAYQTAVAQWPDADRFGVNPASGKEGVIYVYCYRGKEVYYNYDELQFDQYSGRLLHVGRLKDKNRGERLIGMNYDIHVGAIAGLPGKILAFLASLIVASLPITGFLFWWGRKHKVHKTSAAT